MAKMQLKSGDPLIGAMALVLVLVGLGAFFLLLRESVSSDPKEPTVREASFDPAE